MNNQTKIPTSCNCSWMTHPRTCDYCQMTAKCKLCGNRGNDSLYDEKLGKCKRCDFFEKNKTKILLKCTVIKYIYISSNK